MIRLLLATLLIAGAGTVSAQPPASPPASEETRVWLQSDTSVALVPARIAFPRTAGSMRVTQTGEISNQGQGIDNVAQYRSPDGEVIGTAYIYYPGMPHAGLSAYATDQGIRANSPTPVREVRRAVVAAGGVPDAAIRVDYENYRGGYASSAAFIKAGRWIIKLRVSAPGARSAEAEANMTALLNGIRFGAANPARAAAPIEVSACPAGEAQRDAALLPDPPGAEIAAHALLATFDGGGMDATEEGRLRPLPSRVPGQLCLSSRPTVGRSPVAILRGADGEPLSIDGRTRLIAIISDAGEWLEVVHARNLGRYVMLYHNLGSTLMLGGYDSVPSDRQIEALLSNPQQNDGGRVRVPVTLRPNRGPAMHLPNLAPAQAPAPTT